MMEGVNSLLRSHFTGILPDTSSVGSLADLASITEAWIRSGDDPLVSLERELHTDSWTAEENSVFVTALLEDFTNARRFLLGDGDGSIHLVDDPDTRGLREGDVYWAVFVSDAPPLDIDRPEQTEQFIARCSEAGVMFIDITPTARQAMRVVYDRAIKQTTDQQTDRGAAR
jgi:hypothetical protein